MNKVTSKTTIEGAALAATPLTETNCAVEQAAQEEAAKKEAEWQRLLNELLKTCMVDLSVEETEDNHEALYSINGVRVFSRGNISVIGGKAKSRKTFLVSLLSSEMLQSNSEIKFALFDTEQSAFHVQNCTKRVHKLMGWDEKVSDDRLRVFKLREYPLEKRLEYFLGLAYHFKPDFIFLDGVKDLTSNINSETEATKICDYLMILSSKINCHICVVLHENKGNDDLRGHIGTELTNKSETIISVQTKNDISTVSAKDARNEPFETFYFKVNDDGLPEICNAPKGQTAAPKKLSTEHLTILFNKILSENSAGLKLSELRKKVKEIDDVEDTAAKKRIDKAAEYGIIRLCDSSKLYSLSSPSDEVDENDDEDTIDD